MESRELGIPFAPPAQPLKVAPGSGATAETRPRGTVCRVGDAVGSLHSHYGPWPPGRLTRLRQRGGAKWIPSSRDCRSSRSGQRAAKAAVAGGFRRGCYSAARRCCSDCPNAPGAPVSLPGRRLPLSALALATERIVASAPARPGCRANEGRRHGGSRCPRQHKSRSVDAPGSDSCMWPTTLLLRAT